MDSKNNLKYSYAEAFLEYRKLGDIDNVYERLFDKVDAEYLFDVRHAISIGPGPGLNDLAFLKKLTPNLTKYTAVEKNPSCLAELRENAKRILPSNVSINFCQATGQEWQGLDKETNEKADLVLMFQTMYYFDEKEREEFYEKCFKKWLNPNGKLLILHHKDLHETSKTYLLNDIKRLTGRRGEIESYTLKQELLRLGYTIEKVYNYEYSQDLKILNDAVVCFIMHNAQPPYEDDKMVKLALKKLIDEGKDIGYTTGNLFSVVKKF